MNARQKTAAQIVLMVLAAIAAAAFVLIVDARAAPVATAPAILLVEYTKPACYFCDASKPAVAAIRRRGHNVRIIDQANEPQLVAAARIQGFPTFDVVDSSGRVLARHVGRADLAAIEALIDKARAPRRQTVRYAAASVEDNAANWRAAPVNFRMVGNMPAEFLRQCEARAEQCRRALALEWLGAELPAWPAPAVITIKPMAANFGGGGSTSFSFNARQIDQITGTWSGPPAALLDDVIPHEVLHTVFGTHFGQFVPRWADEGAAQVSETPATRRMFSANLIEALKTGHGFPTATLLDLKEYPHDFQAFYVQAHSLAAFLVEHNGRQGYVAFLEDAFAANDWPPALEANFGYNPDDLQANWLEWVRAGSPPAPVEVGYIGHPRGCYRWRPLKRLWERRPGFIVPKFARGGRRPGAAPPNNAQPAALPPAAIAATSPAINPAEPITAAPLVTVPAQPSEPPAAAPITPPAPEAGPGLVAELRARIKNDESLKAGLQARVDELLAKARDKIEANDPPGANGGIVDKAAAGIETALLRKVLIYAGISGGPAAVVAAVAVYLARRGRKKLKAKRAASRSAAATQSRFAGLAIADPTVVERAELKALRVPTTDHEYNRLLEAMRRVAGHEPRYVPVVEMIQNVFEQLTSGEGRDTRKLREGENLGWRDKTKKEA